MGEVRSGEEGGARLFGRARHLGDPALAARDLSLRGRHLHRRSGPGRGIEAAREKAELLGATEIFVDDLREEFVRDFVFPMFRANALYEGAYLLGTAIARPLIAKRQIEIARQVGADAVAHGATGKGNDQVRFELGYYALAPDIKVIAPWREWDLGSRTRLLDYAERHQIPIARDKRGEAPFSVDANLLHLSAEGKVLEDPWAEPEEFVFSRTVAPETAPDAPEYLEIAFARGDPVAIDGQTLSAGGGADAAQRARRQARDRPARSRREPLCRHEIARRLRDAGRHDPAGRPPRDREPDASTAVRRTSRTS